MPALKNVSIEATRRAWAEVDIGALRKNFRVLIEHLPGGCRVLPMVKADGYGIGVRRAVCGLSKFDPWGFGVATTAEGVEIRGLGWSGSVVVVAPVLPLDVPNLIRECLEPVVSGLEALRACATVTSNEKGRLPIHLEVDSGMGRGGLAWQHSAAWAQDVSRVLAEGGLSLAGVLTHFHSADLDREATREQWRRFQEAVASLRGAGVEPGILHAANSAAAMLCGEVNADLVRPGIYLYGGGTWEPAPEPVVSVRARVLDVREVDPGTTVSYGATYTTPGPARLATLAIGYGDGLRRELSNRGRVLIRGRRAPIRGLVCMDSTVIEVTDLGEVRAGDVATLLGRDGDSEIRLEDMAKECGTIGYEILTGWSRRLPRVTISANDA